MGWFLAARLKQVRSLVNRCVKDVVVSVETGIAHLDTGREIHMYQGIASIGEQVDKGIIIEEKRGRRDGSLRKL